VTVQTDESSEAQVIRLSLCYGDKLFVCTGVFCVSQIPAGCVWSNFSNELFCSFNQMRNEV